MVHVVVKNRSSEKEEKVSFMVVRMSMREIVRWLKGSRENDVSSDEQCMFSAL